MKYIYDIVLNFNKQYFNFFEWNINDNIINIRKIPIFKISDKFYYDIKNYSIKLDTDFVKSIENQTLLYLGNNHQNMCLFSNNKEVLGVMIDKNGNVIKRSSLLFDEEDEALELCEELKTTKIEYTIGSKIENNEFICRLEKSQKEKIIKTINELFNNQNISVLKYLYFDLFEEEKDDITYIKNRLINSLNKNNNNIERLNTIFSIIKKEII